MILCYFLFYNRRRITTYPIQVEGEEEEGEEGGPGGGEGDQEEGGTQTPVT